MANTYSDSNGKRWKKSQIKTKTDKAKAEKWETMEYPYCETCGRNASNNRLDCSHLVSVKEAQDSSMCELAWDIDNILIECRHPCHANTEKQSHEERKQRYEKNSNNT